MYTLHQTLCTPQIVPHAADRCTLILVPAFWGDRPRNKDERRLLFILYKYIVEYRLLTAHVRRKPLLQGSDSGVCFRIVRPWFDPRPEQNLERTYQSSKIYYFSDPVLQNIYIYCTIEEDVNKLTQQLVKSD